MMYTFYSYKGGVGRTMALANVAELLYRQGRKVLMNDWDLEAPGLEQFFVPPDQLDEVRKQPGVIDLLYDHKDEMTHTHDLSDPEKLPFTHPAERAFDVADGSASGKLWLITAGRRGNPAEYAKRVLEFDWAEFYDTWSGEAYIEWFRHQCGRLADVVLIDSRTGVTEMGGVCTYHLADVVVMLCAANRQNLRGTLDMARNFARESLIGMRGERRLKTLVVPARIDTNEVEAFNRFLKILDARLDALPAGSSPEQRVQIFDTHIPYVSSYAFDELVAVRYPKGDDLYWQPLTDAYTRLTGHLLELGRQVQAEWDRKKNDLNSRWDAYSEQLADALSAEALSADNAEKAVHDAEIARLEQACQAIEQELYSYQPEFQYYLTRAL